MNIPNLEQKFIEMFSCDTARIARFPGKMFLLIGTKKNTKNDTTRFWVNEKGRRRDWDYVEEKTIASGETEKELIESAEFYKKLCGMNTEDFLKELTSEDFRKYFMVTP